MEKMSLVEVQIDKIIGFTELSEAEPAKDDSPYRVLHEHMYDHKLHKLRLAATLADHRADFLIVT